MSSKYRALRALDVSWPPHAASLEVPGKGSFKHDIMLAHAEAAAMRAWVSRNTQLNYPVMVTEGASNRGQGLLYRRACADFSLFNLVRAFYTLFSVFKDELYTL